MPHGPAFCQHSSSFTLNWGGTESEIGPHNVEDLNSRGQHEDATKVYFLESYIGTLHKALIEFANIFMAVLLHELDQRPSITARHHGGWSKASSWRSRRLRWER